MRHMIRFFAALIIPFAALCAQAAPDSGSGTALGGYVVKVEGNTVYLDLGGSAGIKPGQRFRIITEGEELKHPVTGASLGKILNTVGTGRIVEVQEKYSVGHLESTKKAPAAGQKFRLEAAEAAPSRRPLPQSQAAPETAHGPSYRSPILELDAVDIAVGDVDGDGAQDIVLAGTKKIEVYPIRIGAEKWSPSCAYEEKETGSRFLSLEAADLDGDGRSEIFVTGHNSFFKRVETKIFTCQDGRLTERAAIPWMVRSYMAADGTRRLAVQQLVADRSFPYSGIFDLEYRDGKYGPSKSRVKFKRLEWLYGFGLAARNKKPFLIYYDKADRLRIQFKKGRWTSRDKFGQTAERVDWHDNILQFRPRFYIKPGRKELSGIYTLRNVPGLFGFASSWGIFRHSELHFLRWNGQALEPAWKTQLSGYAAGLAEYRDGRSAKLLVPVRGAEGSTAVWFFDKE